MYCGHSCSIFWCHNWNPLTFTFKCSILTWKVYKNIAFFVLKKTNIPGSFLPTNQENISEMNPLSIWEQKLLTTWPKNLLFPKPVKDWIFCADRSISIICPQITHPSLLFSDSVKPKLSILAANSDCSPSLKKKNLHDPFLAFYNLCSVLDITFASVLSWWLMSLLHIFMKSISKKCSLIRVFGFSSFVTLLGCVFI